MHESCDADGITQEYFMECVNNMHDDLLCAIIPESDVKKYSDIIQQLRKVRFLDKVRWLVKKFNK
ncbi:MAG: hypothetical protein SFU21_03430 [Flavihumibacter sp.]|nr:hypothetical protein [Flavihumibacter sp.]